MNKKEKFEESLVFKKINSVLKKEEMQLIFHSCFVDYSDDHKYIIVRPFSFYEKLLNIISKLKGEL